MQWKSVLALVALLVAGVAHAHGPMIPPNMRGMGPGPTPLPVRSVTAPERVASNAQPGRNVQLVSATKTSVPAQFAGHHGSCSSCGSTPAPVASGCSSCGSGGDNFAGDCCPNYSPGWMKGIWNSYCGCNAGCGHFKMGGCGSGCLRGDCAYKVPIGLYGVTPYGCCLSGVGFGNCGCKSGGCGGGCKMGCGIGCGSGCGIGRSYVSPRVFAWRWGAGGWGCESSCGTGSCGTSSCSTCGSSNYSSPAASSGYSGYSPGAGSYESQPMPAVAPSVMQPTPMQYSPMEVSPMPAEDLPMLAPAVPETMKPTPAAPTPPMVPSPPVPPMNKSARLLPRLFPAAY